MRVPEHLTVWESCIVVGSRMTRSSRIFGVLPLGEWAKHGLEPFVTASNGYMQDVVGEHTCALGLGSNCNAMWQTLMEPLRQDTERCVTQN